MDPIVEAVEMIGRAGARSFEVGYHPAFDVEGNELDGASTPASEFRWWAKATFKGAALAVDDWPGPALATLALVQRVRKDARCAHCERLIAWGSKRRRYCWWTQVDGRWEPGCRSPQ